MATKSLGLMVLFLSFQRVANETEVTGIIGGSAEMRCLYSGEEPFILNKFRVVWQKNPHHSHCNVDAYSPGEKTNPDQCEEFINRTQFSKQLKNGNFSLTLLDIRPKDEFTYECVIQINRTGHFVFFNKSTVNLKVAAYYSKPVITGPVQSGEEMIFTCNSSHGYPLQNLKWINQTDNSLLNATEWHDADSNGTFQVSSTLTIKATSYTNLGCRIENQQLHQNITTTSVDSDSLASSHTNNSGPEESHHKRQMAWIVPIVVTAAVVIVIIILYFWCINRRPSLQETYTAPVEMTLGSRLQNGSQLLDS